MKRSLSHLPLHKRRELKAITEIIVDQVPATEMVILFGSHARGDWVHDVYEHEGITYEYASELLGSVPPIASYSP
jgi:predicted nucleotidyltransferase